MKIDKNAFPVDAETAYPALRKKIQNGDVLLCSGNGIFSTMIRKATDSMWSHVGFILRLDSIDRVMLLESVEPIGVRTVRLSKYLEGYDEDKKKPYNGGMVILRHKKFAEKVTEKKFEKLAQYAVDQFGYPYDKDEIAKIAARIMAAKVPFTKKEWKKIAPDKEFICSEYVARCYEEVGLNVKWNELGFIAPSDFACDDNFELVGVMQSK